MASLADQLGLSTEPSASLKKSVDELEEIEISGDDSAASIFRKLLATAAYRRSLYVRLAAGILPPAVECKLLDHAYGKPVDRVEFEDKTVNVDKMSLDELHERHQRVMEAMSKIVASKSTAVN